MVHLRIGSTYRFTLSSGRQMLVIVHGSQSHPSGQTKWEVSIDGVKDIYEGINEALGENFIRIELVP